MTDQLTEAERAEVFEDAEAYMTIDVDDIINEIGEVPYRIARLLLELREENERLRGSEERRRRLFELLRVEVAEYPGGTTCDWGYCDNPTEDFRISPETGEVLPVCRDHTAASDELAAQNAALQEALKEIAHSTSISVPLGARPLNHHEFNVRRCVGIAVSALALPVPAVVRRMQAAERVAKAYERWQTDTGDAAGTALYEAWQAWCEVRKELVVDERG